MLLVADCLCGEKLASNKNPIGIETDILQLFQNVLIQLRQGRHAYLTRYC